MSLPTPSDDVLRLASQCTRAVINPFASFYADGYGLGIYMETKYILTGCLSVLIWDIVHSIHDDYQLVFRYKFTIKTFVFVFARLTMLLSFIFKMLEVDFVILGIDLYRNRISSNHDTLSYAALNYGYIVRVIASVMYLVGRSSTGLLLYFRVIAIYNNRRPVVAFFGVSWLVVALMHATTIGPIGLLYYLSSGALIKMSVFVGCEVAELVNDTLMFVAVALKLSANNSLLDGEEKQNGVWRQLFSLRRKEPGMQRLTAAFLQDTQIFYLITVCMNLLTIITFAITMVLSHDNAAGDASWLLPNAVIVHIMATKIHRNLRLGRPGFLHMEKTTVRSHIAFAPNAAAGRHSTENPNNASPATRSVSSINGAGPDIHVSGDKKV